MTGRSSLARLLAQERGVRNVQRLPSLTEELIAKWAKQHHRRTGSWPRSDSGRVVGAPFDETWASVQAALTQGLRKLPRRWSSLAKFLRATCGAVPRWLGGQKLTVKAILAWADEHHRRSGRNR